MNKPADNQNSTEPAFLELERLGRRSVNMHDAAAVQRRIDDYFALCVRHDVRPSVAGLAVAFDVHRSMLWKWRRGIDSHLPDASREVLERAHVLLNAVLEQFLIEGKIHAPTAIFLLKNNFGYRDQVEVTPARQNSLGDHVSFGELHRKYAEGIENENK